MLDFGAAEGFRLQGRGFLEFQRRFQRHGEADAASHDHDVAGRGQHVDGGRPVDAGRFEQRFRQRFQARLQLGVVLPLGHHARAGDQAGDEAFRRGDALFLARAQGHGPLGGVRQRRLDVVDEGHGGGAAVAEVADRLDHVRALARLRDRDGQGITRHQRRFVQRDQRHRQGCHDAAQARHDQVGDVVAGVVGAAARDGQRGRERGAPQFAAQFRVAFRVAGQLQGDAFGGGNGFFKHH